MLFRTLGYELSRYQTGSLGVDPFNDMQRMVLTKDPMIFDVGANVGQSVQRFKQYFPDATVHSFEPSASTFQILLENVAHLDDVFPNNTGLGSRKQTAIFFENSSHDMSSFLQPDRDGWGTVVSQRELTLTTLDEYCASKQIGHIDILKSDTQGFDLEVLNGARKMLEGNRIHIIYLEIIFSRMYANIPTFDTLYKFLAERNFELVTFYRFHYQNGLAGSTDALFVNRRAKIGEISDAEFVSGPST